MFMKTSSCALILGFILQLQASLAAGNPNKGVQALEFTRALKSKSKPTASENTAGADFSISSIESEKSVLDSYLTNEVYWYSIDLQVGNPPQNVTVDIDTGSSDLWIQGKSNFQCNINPGCTQYGTFDTNKSSTYKKINDDFTITYGDGSRAKGEWGVDNISIGSAKIDNFTFAVGNDATANMGVFGIGFSKLGGKNLGQENYTNYPTRLVKSGLTYSQTYSIYLNKLSEDKGTILFGGVDHSKYDGQLVTVNMTSDTRTTVNLNNLKITDTEFVYNSSLDVILDTGTTNCYFPKTVVDSIAKSLNAKYDYNRGIYTLPCGGLQYVEFSFGCKVIRVPITNFQLLTNESDTNGKRICVLALVPSSTVHILGDSFLREAYTVFDLDNFQVSIAQANFKSLNETDIEAIPANDSYPVPKAIRCNSTSM